MGTVSTQNLTSRIEELEIQLREANDLLEAIREGAVDALVVKKEGVSQIYTLESSDYTYRILVEKSGEGALSISDTGLILYCNQRFADMVGIHASRIIGSYFNCFVESVGQFEELKTALVRGNSKGEIILNVNGKKIPVYASLTNLAPQVEAIGIVVTDLTEKRKYEEQIASYQRELETKIAELNRT